MVHADQYPKRATGIRPIPMASHALRCGQFRTQPAGKSHRIIPRNGDFRQGISRRSVLKRQGFVAQVQSTGLGHHQQIAVVADAGSAQMRVGKTVQGRVRVVVAAAAVPPFQAGVRAQLHHAKRALCAGVGVAVAARTDEQVGLGRSHRCTDLKSGATGRYRTAQSGLGWRRHCLGRRAGSFHRRRYPCLTHCVTGRPHRANGPKNNPFHRAHAQR